MKIYVDSHNFKCTTYKPESEFLEVETNFFDGKCETLIEGYRFIPSEKSWTREDGITFTGEMITPWKDYNELDAAQREYERELLADAENALAILLGGVTE